jgi:hypothetical protein
MIDDTPGATPEPLAPAAPVIAPVAPAAPERAVYILTADVIGGRAGHLYALTPSQAAAAGVHARMPTDFERGAFGRPPLQLD